MVLFRAIGLVLVLAFVLCMAAHTLTGEAIWRQRAIVMLKWGVAMGLAFIGFMVLRRAAVFL
ncbi:MAG: hypothetical protein QM742_14135 [Aquabacterium sp.]